MAGYLAIELMERTKVQTIADAETTSKKTEALLSPS